jgi:hypothetical protein
MFIQSEEKAQGWRAVAILKGRGECLLFVGRSSTHVRGEYVESFVELLDEEEKDLVTGIQLQQWQGTPDAGRWVHKNDLRIPAQKMAKMVA